MSLGLRTLAVLTHPIPQREELGKGTEPSWIFIVTTVTRVHGNGNEGRGDTSGCFGGSVVSSVVDVRHIYIYLKVRSVTHYTMRERVWGYHKHVRFRIKVTE